MPMHRATKPPSVARFHILPIQYFHRGANPQLIRSAHTSSHASTANSDQQPCSFPLKRCAAAKLSPRASNNFHPLQMLHNGCYDSFHKFSRPGRFRAWLQSGQRFLESPQARFPAAFSQPAFHRQGAVHQFHRFRKAPLHRIDSRASVSPAPRAHDSSHADAAPPRATAGNSIRIGASTPAR